MIIYPSKVEQTAFRKLNQYVKNNYMIQQYCRIEHAQDQLDIPVLVRMQQDIEHHIKVFDKAIVELKEGDTGDYDTSMRIDSYIMVKQAAQRLLDHM